MLHTVISKNSYQDSVNLMLLTKKLSGMQGINRISVMMGTPSNMDIFKNAGLFTEKLESASANDICVVVDSVEQDIITKVMQEIEDFIHNQSVQSKGEKLQTCRTWEGAVAKLPGANLAMISIAGEYVAQEADKALERGLNVFIFSDNVSIEDEKKLKEKAYRKGLLVMGPDCGTGIIQGIPLAFANVVSKGNIGVIGASGTGIQEVTTIISRKGGGITQAIGLGGRDLSEEIGGITAQSAIEVLEKDEQTEVVVFISKPPAKSVRDKIVQRLVKINKPVVAIFMGEKPNENHDNMHYVWTLEDAALKALELARLGEVPNITGIEEIKANGKQRGIKGLYCGGTLAAECAMIMAEEFGIETSKEHPQGIMLHHREHKIIDLGDDAYTKGKPHPMIDPSARFDMLHSMCDQEETAIVLMDFVIGFGGNDDMAGVTAPIIEEITTKLARENKKLIFVASVTGTEEDLQVFSQQVEKLKDVGVVVCDTNTEAVKLCIDIMRYLQSKDAMKVEQKIEHKNTLWEKPMVINVGLRKFSSPIAQYGGEVVQYIWNPIAGGDKHLARLVEQLKKI